MNEQLTKIAEVLADSEANGSGIYRKRSAYSRRVAHFSVVEFGGDAEVESAAKLFKAAPKLLSALANLLDEVQDLIGESYGVAGLHLNGDVAPWSEIEEGGRFERLCSMYQAIDAIREATE